MKKIAHVIASLGKTAFLSDNWVPIDMRYL
jgi:hypothetical protein